jgi:hypothetical protein
MENIYKKRDLLDMHLRLKLSKVQEKVKKELYLDFILVYNNFLLNGK